MIESIDAILNEGVSEGLVIHRNTPMIDRQNELIRRIVENGETVDFAALQCGISTRHAYILTGQAEVQQAIQNKMWDTLKMRDAPRARRVLIEIMEDKNAGKAVRMECAKTLLNRAGYVEQRATVALPQGVSKAPSEMSGDELRKEINKLHSEIANRVSGAKVIDATPITQVIDILG